MHESMIMDSPEKSYYSERDAVDMFIDRLRGLDTDVETRLAMAGMFFYPTYGHLDRLVNVILKGPDYMDAENMVEDIMKNLEAQDGKNDM